MVASLSLQFSFFEYNDFSYCVQNCKILLEKHKEF
jgi:hypothetical protein